MGREGRGPEPYAREAKAALDTLVSGRVVRAQDGRSRRDRYGRRLAHVFLADGSNVQAMMLRRGLATLFFVPHNGELLTCYAGAEQEARTARRGIWSLAELQAVDAIRLGKPTLAYHVVSGTVTSVSCRRRGVRLLLDGLFRVQIAKQDLRYFDGQALCRLGGHRVSVRGLVRRNRGAPQMRIRHPVYLDLGTAATR